MKTSAKQRWFWAALIFGVYTAIGLLSSLGAYLCECGMGQTLDWGPLLRQELKTWYSFALLTIPGLWFCSRNRLEPGRVKNWVARHFAAALVAAVAYALLTSWLVAGERSVMHPDKTLTFSYMMRNMGVHYLVSTMFLYWVVVFAHSGWLYYQQSRERELQTAQLRQELVEARLSALRMQLNPHFLFNTLHAVSALIHEDPEAADRVVARLSELLRLSLDQSKPQEVPLREEMGFLERYLEIEQTRFGERLTVVKDIPNDAQQALVPFLVLQPLVENAIRHGIEPREDAGRLAIEARRNNGHLQLRVRDNGSGLPTETNGKPVEGIGLSNTRSRLQHLYGDKFQFQLTSAQGGGLEAFIEIPFHTSGPDSARTPVPEIVGA